MASVKPPLSLMVWTRAKNRLSAPVFTGTTPAGNAGAVKVGRTMRSAPSPNSASRVASVQACAQARAVGSQVWMMCMIQRASAMPAATWAGLRPSTVA